MKIFQICSFTSVSNSIDDVIIIFLVAFIARYSCIPLNETIRTFNHIIKSTEAHRDADDDL